MRALEPYQHLRGMPHVQPHGCWFLVARALEEVHGIELPAHWGATLPESDLKGRALLLLTHLREHGVQVLKPEPGDVAVLSRQSAPAHVALCVGDGWAIHSTSTVGMAYFSRLADLARAWGGISYWRPVQ